MGKFDTYKIDLKGMDTDSDMYEFVLDNDFFHSIDAPEVQKGKVHVDLAVKKLIGAYELSFKTEGTIQVPCDRCLDDMDLDIVSTDTVKVKLGSTYAEEGDIVVIPEEEGIINVAWFMYEFIALSIPMKHVHAPGKCNKAMVGKLNRHLRFSANDEVENDNWGKDLEDTLMNEDASQEIDPRWNELKKILDNN